jgi:hypothetical protein
MKWGRTINAMYSPFVAVLKNRFVGGIYFFVRVDVKPVVIMAWHDVFFFTNLNYCINMPSTKPYHHGILAGADTLQTKKCLIKFSCFFEVFAAKGPM